MSDLITQSFGIDRADEAFRLLEERTEPCLAIRLTYPAAAGPEDPVRLKPSPADRSVPGVGWIGAGAFSTGTLLPAFRDAGFERLVAVATAAVSPHGGPRNGTGSRRRFRRRRRDR